MEKYPKFFRSLYVSLWVRNGFFLAIIYIYVYIATFVFVLPLLCQNLGFSTYFVEPKAPYKILDSQNEQRTEQAREILKSFKQSTATVRLRSTNQARVEIEFSIVLLTAYRSSSTHYLLQVAARLLPQVTSDEGKSVVTIINCDPQSGLNEDVLYLSNFTNVINNLQRADGSSKHLKSPVNKAPEAREKEDVMVGLETAFKHNSAVINRPSPFDSNALKTRQKDDFIVGLETALQYNSTYVLMMEDDALPSENLLKDLRFVLKHKMRWKFLKKRSDWAFLKLYYPEKWQGYGWPELPELILIGALAGCLGVWVELKFRNRRRNKKLSLCFTFIMWTVYVILVVYTVGRAHWIELRKLSPFMYSVVNAPGCCTPCHLYQRTYARDLANFLKSVHCNDTYPVDIAVDDFAKESNLERYLVMPNMVSHIGVHSSLSSRLKHFAEFYLMFKP